MPREMEVVGGSSKAMEQQSGVPSCDLEILRREITSLMILLTDKQSDVLYCDSEILKKITSLKSEITSLKLARKRKGLVLPPDVNPTVRRKISSVRRIAEDEGDMADQEMVDLSNSSGQKDADSRKIEPTSRFKSNFEQGCPSCGSRHEAQEPVEFQFDYILHDTEAVTHQLGSLASILRESSSPIISFDKIKDLMDTTYCLFRVFSGIAEDFMKSENLMTEEEHVGMTDLLMDEGKSSMETHQMMDNGKSSLATQQMAVHCQENQETKKCVEMMMVDGKSSMITQSPRMVDNGKSGVEKKTSSIEFFKSCDSGFQTGAVMGMGLEEEKPVEGLKDLKMSELKRDEDQQEMMLTLLEEEEEAQMAWEKKFKEQQQEEEQELEEEEKEEEEEAEFTDLEITESIKEEMDRHEMDFARYRSGWESTSGMSCGSFEDQTTLSPMHYTHCTPGLIPCCSTTGSSLQIYSVKIVELKHNLYWPLYVYGVVAARDNVDRNRNVLFCRTRDDCQKLTLDDPFLHLTGPTRAIAAQNPVEFEVELKVKGRTKSRDRALIIQRHHFHDGYDGLFREVHFVGCFCTAEVSLEQFDRTVQATILGVRVGEGGSRLFKYGGRVACYSPSQEVVVGVTDTSSRQVTLLDSHDSDAGEMLMGSDGYLVLSRNVVSVKLRRLPLSVEFVESLEFVIQAYSESNGIAAEQHVKFKPKLCNISQSVCDIGGCQVEITVAWSALVRKKMAVLSCEKDLFVASS